VLRARDRGDCLLVTAGHSLQALYAELPKRTGEKASLFDGWKRTASQEPIPFDLLGATRFVVDDNGLDLGLIHLRDLHARNLRANGIKPFDEKGWRDPPPASEMVRYAVIGLPDQFIERQTTESGAVRVSVNPTFVYLEGVDAPEGMERPFPCFYGKLADNLYNRNAGIALEGMAGFQWRSDGGPFAGAAPFHPGSRIPNWRSSRPVMSSGLRATRTNFTKSDVLVRADQLHEIGVLVRADQRGEIRKRSSDPCQSRCPLARTGLRTTELMVFSTGFAS